MKNNESKLYIKEKRNEIIWQLSYEGYNIKDIIEIMNPLERTWTYRIIKKMPEDWQPNCSKNKKAT